MVVKVNVIFDQDAGVYVGTSDDLPGLVVEADSLDDLAHEVHDLVPAMMQTRSARVSAPVAMRLSYTDAAACA
jgi:hypothetical protein